MEEKEFKKLILNDEYIKWLESFIEKNGEFDSVYFVHEHYLTEKDSKMIDYLENLFKELNKYTVKNNINKDNIFYYEISYNDKVYTIRYDGECYSCCKRNTDKKDFIEYKDFKKSYQKNMETNFEFLKERVIDSLKHSDLENIRNELSKLNTSTIFSGVGGSSVVSEFGSKVINKKNGIITINSEPRDFIYRNNDAFKNIVSCSYGGNNYGVQLSFLNNLKKYLLSNNSFNDKDVIYLKYNTTIGCENSFISLGATLIPISILMDYYLEGKDNVMLDSIEKESFNFSLENNIYEIFSGYDTSTAAKYLESTMVESGIGIPIVHDKYAYCHGRSTSNINYSSTAIYYNRNTEFDRIMLEELKKYYKIIVVINSKFNDQILDDYQMLVQSMYLTKYIAEKKSKDLSKVEYSPIVKKLYKYNGEI